MNSSSIQYSELKISDTQTPKENREESIRSDIGEDIEFVEPEINVR